MASKQTETEAKEAAAFNLDYYTDKGPRFVQVYMKRYSDEECFTVHLLVSDVCIGNGDTKEQACSDARIALHHFVDFGSSLAAYRAARRTTEVA